MGFFRRLRAKVPTREQIQANRWLSWLAPWLGHPRLWHWSRRGVAMGVALGVFFGLLIPVAQIPLSVGAAVVLRANVPAAAASTLVTNPITFGPVYFAAYRLGTWVTGDRLPEHAADPASAQDINADAGIWERLQAMGKPLMIGLSILASLIGLTTYAVITLVWRWRTLARRRNGAHRRWRRKPGSEPPGSD
ncbi:DUF2062 domain-containing protein [Denitromonas halophila]|uniref:DUF2062 domain-containing protein n=1 Tax=Denitromonas halophila TaxID=1629404 RepID=A0A557R1J9_9RHOO|nr:DUF2062 domain-containing protein [Denitromonas halophila]TVO59031.1 DUF2062 domain-containing protein [Denitromonas halophila]